MSNPEIPLELRLRQLEEAVTQIQKVLHLPPTLSLPTQEPKPEDVVQSMAAAVPELASEEAVVSLQISDGDIVRVKPEAAAASAKVAEEPRTRAVLPPREPGPIDRFFQRLTEPEFLLNTLGTGLLLLGIVFMFGYAIANDLLSPAMWVGIGYLIGASMLGIGWWINQSRSILSQFLFGGGVGAFYITTFSAYVILEVIGYPAAFGLMAVTTAGAYALSVWQKDQILALIAAIGGLLTPFVLPTEVNSIPGLISYSIVLIAGSLAIYYAMRWRALLMVTAVGGWIVYLTALSGSLFEFGSDLPFNDKLFLQIGALVYMFGFGFVPAVRGLIDVTHNPTTTNAEGETIPAKLPWEAHLFYLIMPVLGLFPAIPIWELDPQPAGAIFLIAGVAFGAAAYVIYTSSYRDRFFETVLLTSLSLATLGTIMALSENEHTLFAILTIEALVLMVASWYTRYRVIEGLAHTLFIGLLIAAVIRLTGTFTLNTTTPILRFDAIVDLMYIVALVAAARFTRSEQIGYVYDITANLLILGWLGRELGTFLDSSGWLSTAYIIVAAGIYACGTYFKKDVWQYQGLFTFIAALLSISIGWDDLNSTWDNIHIILITASVAAMFYISQQQEDKPSSIGGHVGIGILMLWLAARLIVIESPTFFLHATAFVNLLVIGVAVYAIYAYGEEQSKPFFITGLHLLGLGLIYRECWTFENRDAITSALWGSVAIILLLLGVTFKEVGMRRLGLATILLVVAKLFVIDLANVSTFIRIFLFIGFGIVLLTTSYLFRSLWQDENAEAIPVGEEIDADQTAVDRLSE